MHYLSIINLPKISKRRIRAAVYLGLFLALLQLFDGAFTLLGIYRFGPSIEGNPILRSLMYKFGPTFTVTAVKVLAIFIVFSLTRLAMERKWICHAMGAVSSIYIFAAIIPWIVILSNSI